MSLAVHQAPLPIAAPGRLHPLLPLARATWIQAVRRSEIHVLLIMLGLYGLGCIVLRLTGIDSQQSARFATGMGLQLGSTLATLLVIIVASRQLPMELEQRTIYPILAKPISRGQFLLGRTLPVWAAGVAALLVFTGVTLLVTPHLAFQQPAVLVQALLLKAAALALLAAFATWLSLRLPAAVAMLATGGVAFAGSIANNALTQAGGRAGAVAARLLPDVALLDQLQRYVDGGAQLPAGQLLGLLAYAGLWTLLFAVLSRWTFNRMAL